MFNEMPVFDPSVFPRTYHAKGSTISSDQDLPLNDNDTTETDVDRPGSPGMEILIQEEQETSRRMNKATKFNKAFEVARVVADWMSNFNKEQFDFFFGYV